MQRNVFAPKLSQSTESQPSTTSGDTGLTADLTSKLLLQTAHIALLLFAFLLPLFFLPGLVVGLGFTKVMLGVGFMGVVIIALSLLALRVKTVHTVLPLPVALMWGVFVAAFVSGLFSDDTLAAFRGSLVETQTVAFLGLLALVVTAGLLLQYKKKLAMWLLQLCAVSASIVLVYVGLRLLVGPVLGMASFPDVTASPVGNFNDVAVVASLVILTFTISLVQLSLSKVMQSILAVMVLIALGVLSVVNFFYVWLIVGFFGLLVLLYIVAQDTLFNSSGSSAGATVVSKISIAVAVLICVVSGGFIVAGDYLGSVTGDMTNVQYLEVRPSLSATIGIAQAVYVDDALFGVGPNQFISSWRAFKDPSINQTIFWNTDFRSGSGYVPTLFVTLGLVGGLLLLVCHVWYFWSGVRMLLKPAIQDQHWYYFGLVTFTSAIFLWTMSYVYVPSATILLLAALSTGLSLAAGAVLQPKRVWSVSLVTNRQRGFVLMAVAVMFITGTMGTWFSVGKQYVAQSSFNQTQLNQSDIATVDQAALASYQLYPDHRFLGIRAQIALREMNQLLAIPEPTEIDQQRFLEVSDRALLLTDAAVAAAPTQPTYHAVLAGVYNNLALAGVPGAVSRATSSIARAAALDPNNPSYALLTAQLAANRGDIAVVRQALNTALTQKRNYTEALFALAQLDIAEGDVAAAITTTRSIITLEPNNPARYYQLGILQAANNNPDGAADAYRTALSLDPDFANARYLLALLQLQAGAVDDSLANLEIVYVDNQDNQQLQQLIAALRAGEVPTIPGDEVSSPVSDVQPDVDEETVTATVAPDSDLLTPLNTVSEPDVPESSIEIPTAEIEPEVNEVVQ